jgi:hypothetical protein
MRHKSMRCAANIGRNDPFPCRSHDRSDKKHNNLALRFIAAIVFLVATTVLAQNPSKPAPPASEPKSVTVPITLDQGRVVIDVDLLLPDGSTQRIRGWADNGNPDLYMSQRIAGLMRLAVRCAGQICIGTPEPPGVALEIAIGGMKISLSPMREIKIPARTPALVPGMSAEINIPSAILRRYDVLINFPDRELTIGLPGQLKFNGVKSKMRVDADGLIQIPGKIGNQNYDLGLDLGSSVNSLSEELFDKLANAHPDWPHMIGTVGPFNSGELASEPKWRVMRLDRALFGPLFLTDVAVAGLPRDRLTGLSPFSQRPSVTTAAVLSSEALLNYRVGLDYAHSTVYFDIGRTVKFPDFDVVGLILRPEGDTGFTIVGVADFDGNPSVAGVQAGDHLVAIDDIPVAESTLGQVWSLLEGSPGQERKLTIERSGKPFTVVARAQHFLGDAPANDETKGKSKQN